MGTLVRYTRPNYRHLSKTFNELMDEFFAPINARTTDNLTPKVDIRENEQEFEFLLELPGVRKENLQIELEEDVLYVSFHRSFHLPQGLDKENITAQYRDGILRLT